MRGEDHLEKGILLENEPTTVAVLNSNWVMLSLLFTCLLGIIIWLCVAYL
jgi:hypothetical protein